MSDKKMEKKNCFLKLALIGAETTVISKLMEQKCYRFIQSLSYRAKTVILRLSLNRMETIQFLKFMLEAIVMFPECFPHPE